MVEEEGGRRERQQIHAKPLLACETHWPWRLLPQAATFHTLVSAARAGINYCSGLVPNLVIRLILDGALGLLCKQI